MARIVKRFSDEQIERANRVDVVEYARSQGLEMVRSGQWYKAKGMGGLYFRREANTWHWETEDVGGTGSISLCMKLENKTWVEAVRTLLGEEMEPIRHDRNWKPEPEQPKEFRLPDVNNTYKHMIAYLTKTRGIEPSVLKAMIDRKYIYENTHKSCVFVGRDKEGIAHHASVRSTNTEGKVFKQDVPGSQKEFSFNIPGNSGTLNVFEAPIDLLSYVSLQKLLGKQTKDSYLSLGGVTDKALERFLADYNIEKIRVCTDADEAGEKALMRIYEKYGEQYHVTRHRPLHKDFNEDLLAYRAQQEQIQVNHNRPVQTDYFIRGSCEVLVICDSPEEVDAYRELQELRFKSFGVNDYSPDEYYLSYRNIEQVNNILKENPDITKVWVRASKTATGEHMVKELKASIQNIDLEHGPERNSYVEDLAQMRAIEAAVQESTVVEQQMMAEM